MIRKNIIALLILFISFTTLSTTVIDLYENRFGINIKKSISAAEKVGGLYQNNVLNTVVTCVKLIL